MESNDGTVISLFAEELESEGEGVLEENNGGGVTCNDVI